MSAITSTLIEIAALLRAEGYDSHAEDAERARQAFESATANGCYQLATNSFWGGSGSLAAVHFSPENLDFFIAQSAAHKDRLLALRDRDDEVFKRSNRRLAELIAQLSDEFVSVCERFPKLERRVAHVQMIGGLYKKWISEGLR